MGFWTKAIIGGAAVFAIGSAWVFASAHALDVDLVDEARTTRGHLLVDINAERITIYNRPWDGVGHVGGIVGPLLPSVALESPPDLMLCVVDASATTCYANGDKGAPVSYCYDSFRCKWQVTADRHGGFALVIFDLDIVNGRSVSDLVDIVSVTGTRAGAPAMETRVRALIEAVAPTTVRLPEMKDAPASVSWRPGEARRRARAFSQAPVGYCATGCELEQSAITLNWI